jgi:two-component system, OmpR family, response regulator
MSKNAKRILIVDDDIDYLAQMKLYIEKMGFEVTTAESQKDGLQLIEKMRPDLAIVDLMMENEDSGFVLSYRLKKKYPEVPVIIATAVASETGMVFGLNSPQEKGWIKADRYLEKGLRPDQLQREIELLLNH